MYPPYAWGGAEKAIAMLAEALVRKGHNVVVVTLHPGYLERTEERNGIRIYNLPRCGIGKLRAGSGEFLIWKPRTSFTLTI
jgi:hypothetical protein